MKLHRYLILAGIMSCATVLPCRAAEAAAAPKDIPEAMVAAAQAGDGAAIRLLIVQSFNRRGSLDEAAVSVLLDRLVQAGDAKAFSVLLREMRQTTYGRSWQVNDALLQEAVREKRQELIDAMLADRLDPARLEVAREAGDAEMQKWIARRAAEVRQSRGNIDALVEAAGKGDLEVMRRLLDAGTDVNAVTSKESEHTALTIAAAKSQLEAVRLLLDRGAAVDQPKHPGWDYTPLCVTKSVPIAELLKAHGANVHAKLFRRDVSILTYIARWGGPDMVEWMLKQGLDPKMIGDNRQNLLFEAGDARTAEILLKAGVDPNAVDEFGSTPLSSAQKGVAQKLIEAGAKLPAGEKALMSMFSSFASPDSVEAAIKTIEPVDPVILQKGLISAAHTDQGELAEVLLRHGAKANEPGFVGEGTDFPMLPLMMCTVHGSPKTAKVLLAHGADPNGSEKWGGLLQNAIRNGHRELAKILRDAGAKGVSDLAFAIGMKDEAKVAELLKSAPAYSDDTAFWEKALPAAARLGHLEGVRAAIAKGVPLTGPQPLDDAFEAAANEGQYEVLGELVAQRKTTDMPEDLYRALWTAVYNSHPYDRQRRADAFEKCVQILLAAKAPLTGTLEKRSDLVTTAVFTRQPGGNPKVIEMLVAAGADPNPSLGDREGTPRRLSDVVQEACECQGCSTPFDRTVRAFENLAKVKIKR